MEKSFYTTGVFKYFILVVGVDDVQLFVDDQQAIHNFVFLLQTTLELFLWTFKLVPYTFGLLVNGHQPPKVVEITFGSSISLTYVYSEPVTLFNLSSKSD